MKENDTNFRTRLISRRAEDKVEVVSIGRKRQGLGDGYVRLLSSRWRHLVAFIAGLYFGLNIFFSLLYLATGGVQNARPGSFADASLERGS